MPSLEALSRPKQNGSFWKTLLNWIVRESKSERSPRNMRHILNILAHFSYGFLMLPHPACPKGWRLYLLLPKVLQTQMALWLGFLLLTFQSISMWAWGFTNEWGKKGCPVLASNMLQTLCKVVYVHYFISSFQQSYAVSTINPILQIKKQKLKQIN